MSADRWRQLRQIFDAVVDLDETERERKLADLCGSDDALRAEILNLLSAATTPNDFLDTPIARRLNSNLHPGALLMGRFALVTPLGHGGMGEVWRAHDRQLKEDVAIKIVRPDITETQGLHRFTREVNLARRISHPNVCRVYEFFDDTSAQAPQSFLTMELLEGETLAARLSRAGPMTPDEALVVFRNIVAGLGAAHDADVIHRDLKPSNIMLVGSASSRRAVIMDFGLARDPIRIDSDGRTTPGTLVGTPEYMAPEQVTGGALSRATDIYALGLILFEMLRGARPFAGTSTLDSWMRRAREGPERLSGAVPGVQARIDMVIARCLEYQPERRYQSAAELLKALEQSVYIAVPRSRGFWAAAAAVALLAVTGAGFFAWSRTRAEIPPAETLKWFEDAQEALAEGASLRALNDITRAIELAPGFAPSHAALAEIRLELDMPGAAQESMLRATELARDRRRLPDAYVAYMDGVQSLLQHDCAKAIDALQHVVAAVDAARKPFRMVTVSRALERCDRPDDAQALMKDAAALDPRNAAVPLRSARLAAARREYTAAYANLDTAEQLFRDRNNFEGRGEVLTLRGTFEVAQDRLQEADAALAKALELAASVDDVRQTIRALLQQAIVHRKRGSVAAAADLTAKAIDLGRRHNLESLTLEGLFAAGNVHVVANQFAEAQSLFEQALRIAEAYRHEELKARAQLALASVYVRVVKPEQALQAIAAAEPYYQRVNLPRTLAVASALRGQVGMMQGDYDRAREQFALQLKRATEANDREQSLVARENLASALAARGDYADSLMAYEAAVDEYRRAGRTLNAAFALMNTADLMSRMGRSNDARAALTAARALSPEGAGVRARADWVEGADLLRRHAYGDALSLMNAAKARGPEPSSRRAAAMATIACAATVHLKQRPEADRACKPVFEAAHVSSDAAIRVESGLTAAEVNLHQGAPGFAEEFLRATRSTLDRAMSHEDRWRFLALSAIAADGKAEASERRQALTRELEAIRLKWQDKAYSEWVQRTDVRTLLRQAGVADGINGKVNR